VLIEPFNSSAREENGVRRAEGDWMRQMFSGTIHNIGNVITVARLAVSELEEANNEKNEVLDLILQEILPDIQQSIKEGTVAEFLTTDAKGSEYMASMQQLLEHQKRILQEQADTVNALNQKLNHITEIIGLQQRLISGVGRREIVSIDSLIRDAVKMMGESANRHEVQVVEELQGKDLVHVDSSMTTQVFINLIKNAIEALDDVIGSERSLQISTKHMERDGIEYVRCRFADNGPGMKPEVLDKVFDFGYTTKTADGYGRGVGLNYCRRTIEKFEGILEVDSELGAGTTFNVWLRVAEDD
jgi:two-component system NtrC family sensor kinase